MARQSFLQYGDSLLALAARVQRHGVDVGISRVIRRKFRCLPQFGKRRVRFLEPRQCQTKRVVRRGLARRDGDRTPKRGFAVAVATKLPIEISEIDR